MDNKEIHLISQYYNSTHSKTLYCKECGCAVDREADIVYEKQSLRSCPSSLIIIAFALLLLFIAIFTAADFKKTADNYKETINKLSSELYITNEQLDFFRSNVKFVIKGSNIYHNRECSFIKNAKNNCILYDINILKQLGYKPCKNCHAR